MEKLPKLPEFKAPDGYFEGLPDQILSKTKSNSNYSYLKWAAVFVFFASISIYFLLPNSESLSPAMALDENINLYIDSEYWTAEDILAMSEDPNELLDELFEEEMTIFEEFLEEENLSPQQQ